MSSPQAIGDTDIPSNPAERRAVPRLSLRGIEKSFDTTRFSVPATRFRKVVE